MTALLSLITADFRHARKKASSAAILLGMAALSFLFAIGFAATGLSIYFASLYDPFVATLLVAALFTLFSGLLVAVNYFVQRKLNKKREKSQALRGAAMSLALAQIGRSNKTRGILALAGLLLAVKLKSGSESEDR